MSTLCDHNRTIEAEIVGKWLRRLGVEFDRQIFTLHARGGSPVDIKDQQQEVYGIDVSTSAINLVTDMIDTLIQKWQTSPLDTV